MSTTLSLLPSSLWRCVAPLHDAHFRTHAPDLTRHRVQALKHIFFYINDPTKEYETVAVLSISLLLLTHVLCKASATFKTSKYLHHSVRDVITVLGALSRCRF